VNFDAVVAVEVCFGIEEVRVYQTREQNADIQHRGDGVLRAAMQR